MITCNIQIFTTFFRCVPCDAQKIHQNLSFGFVNISYEGNQTLAQSQQQNQGLQYTWLISNKIKISMFFTPRTKRKDTQTTDFSSNNLSRVTNFHTNQLKKSVQSQQSLKTDKKPQNSNKQSDKLWPIAKLHINVKKKKVSEQEFIQESPTLKVNPFKYKSTTCSKMSTQPHGNIVAYGITSFKGHRNIVNPHFSSINLGHLNHITFSESFDGQNAAKIIKQQFRIQMANLSDKLKQDTYQVVSEAVKEVFQNVQHKVVEKQYLSQQNSGSTLLSVLFHPQFLMVANAGSSQVICLTKNGSLLKLSQSHTTINQKQRKRIIKNGGRIYQTVVNVPFHDELQIQGPLRISPSGLFFTRCLGKGLDFRKEISCLSQGEYNNPENHLNITWKPEIKYLNIEDVEWVGIFSEQILKNCSLQEIKNCVHSEMKKKSQQFSQHHIAQEASKKIIERLINGGVANALTCIIVLLKQVSPISKPQNQRQQISIKIRRRKAGQADNNMSLTYIGDRKSFVKQVSVSCGKDKSMSNKNKITNERQLKRQFSFNPLH